MPTAPENTAAALPRRILLLLALSATTFAGTLRAEPRTDKDVDGVVLDAILK